MGCRKGASVKSTGKSSRTSTLAKSCLPTHMQTRKLQQIELPKYCSKNDLPLQYNLLFPDLSIDGKWVTRFWSQIWLLLHCRLKRIRCPKKLRWYHLERPLRRCDQGIQTPTKSKCFAYWNQEYSRLSGWEGLSLSRVPVRLWFPKHQLPSSIANSRSHFKTNRDICNWAFFPHFFCSIYQNLEAIQLQQYQLLRV